MMETPSSTRRVTRSQSASLLNSASKLSKGGDGCSRSRSHRADRLALLDITNDSPIAGVTTIAGENKTPLSRRKTIPRAGPGNTPCSGETLLRCQVKSLLQRVEEESEFPKLETHYLQLQKLCLAGKCLISPAGLLAPTPANTPEIFCNPQLENKSVPKGEVGLSFFASEAFHLPEVLDVLHVEKVKPIESPITRALTFDSPEKSETVASVNATAIATPSLDLSYQENCTQEKTADDDNASEWSTHVNISSPRSTAVDEDEDEFAEVEDKEEDAEDEEDEFEECNEIDDDLCDELCRELSKICVQEPREGLPQFTGTHTRFHYNSDDEIEEEEVVVGATSPNVLHLKGLPTPKGKHLRFPDEEDETSRS
ncbi:uncharacterized protein LOC116247235 [Nymphaea colorata]|nr:uncharacterized protein LOC116247235 [Nymphaea colorata]